MAKEKLKRDMFDYIGDGKSLYDIVGRMIGVTDFSTTGMICNALKLAYEAGDNTIHFAKQTYDYAFKKLTPGLDTYFTTEEQIKIMTDLHALYPRKFTSLSITDAVNYLHQNKERYEKSLALKSDVTRNKEFETEYETISEKIFGAVISKCEKDIKEGRDYDGQIREYLLDIRSKIFKGAYYPRINNEIKRRFPNRATIAYEEAEVATYAATTLFDEEKMAEYDEYLGEYTEQVRAFKERAALSTRLNKKRTRVIDSELALGMKPEQFEKAKKDGIDSVIFSGKKRRPSREGTFSWAVRELREPKVILDTMAEYSANGDENQRVIAVNYGKFVYGTMFNREGQPTISSEALDLVGVTRLGKDGVKTYFVLAPFTEVQFKSDRLFRPEVDGPNERRILVDGKEAPIVDGLTANLLDSYRRSGMRPSNPKYQAGIRTGRLHMILSDKIPAEKADYYAKVAFSDRVLKRAVEGNYRFAGEVRETMYGSGMSLDASYTHNPYDVEALMYAYRYPGQIGRKQYINFEAYCKSTDLMAKHLGIVRDVTNGEYDLDKHVDDEVK